MLSLPKIRMHPLRDAVQTLMLLDQRISGLQAIRRGELTPVARGIVEADIDDLLKEDGILERAIVGWRGTRWRER